MGNGCRWNVRAHRNGRRDQRPWTEHGARITYGVAAHLGVVTHYGAEVAEAGFVRGIRRTDDNGLLVQTQVGTNHARAEVRAIPQDRVSDVVEVRQGNMVHQE